MATRTVAKTRFGQLVIGPPGSGKTTYVGAMAQLLRAMGRKVAIVNLDPANENMNYTADVDVSELIKLEDVMDTMGLGPNGGLVYCMQVGEDRLLSCVLNRCTRVLCICLILSTSC